MVRIFLIRNYLKVSSSKRASMRIRKAIILASGLGKRLRELKGDLPKCFHELKGRPLITYPLRAMRVAGVEKFVVVIPQGYSERTKELLGDFSAEIVENGEIEKGNAYSLLLGLREIDEERFLVSCCDSLYPPSAIFRLVSESDDGDVVVAMSKSSSFIDPEEASKVKLRSRNVVQIGKDLKDFDGYDTGLFIMSSSVREIAEKMEWSREVNLFELLQKCIDSGLNVVAADLGDIPWTEIDTPEDYFEVLRGRRREVLEAFLREVEI